ncbi:MAG: DNA gyrase subunit A [Chloroflexi bacterium]|nr:DNA gyrase subunit A [Chloroflexota bacterium]
MDFGTVRSVDINQQMRSAYLDYAMSVIVSRALPDVRDGLKPVHRRILYAMHDMGIRATGSYKKSARIVGEVLGKYHPHGDIAVYDSMARMAQDFSMRYPMVDGQGNFGSVDGDSPAAMRYTEARLGRLAEEMLTDIDKDTVNFEDNFDGSLQEPAVLPARLPNMLLNGASGIAVGMATNIPPHNMGELVAALTFIIENYDQIDDVTIEDLLQFIPGPDFPTGGVIVGDEGIRQAYGTGRGRIVLRGKALIEESERGRHQILITEIPYQLNKTTLIERIAILARDGKLDEISDLRDESDRTGMRIIIELKKTAHPRQVLNQLYKYTPLQSTFGVQMLALIDGEPRLLSLKRALHLYIEHRLEVITRRSQFELAKARERAHILEGLLIALANLDEVVQTIRQSPDVEIAKERLMTRFGLTDRQAQAILDLQLRRLVALERQKIEDEHKALMEQIEYLEDLLAHPKKMLQLIKEDLGELAEIYSDERRTQIVPEASGDLSEEDLYADETLLVTITERGYVKRVDAKYYRSQRRGGRGVKGHITHDEDEVLMVFSARTFDTILFFSDRGKVYSEKAYQIPDAGRAAKGIAMANVLAIGPQETITAAVAVPDFGAAEYCTMVTRQGKIKRVALSEFAAVRPSGLIAMGLADNDELGWVRLTSGDEELIIVTEHGQALRFHEKEVRPMGRQAQGVNGIQLKADDHVVGMEVVEPGGDLLVITTRGYGKRTSLDEYSAKGRATMGILTIDKNALPKIGLITSARVVQPTEDLITLISSKGIVLRTNAEAISRYSRATRGVQIMNLEEDDSMASMARFAAEDLRKAGAIDVDNENGLPSRNE